MTNGGPAAIEVAGLEKRYGNVRAVDGLSFSIAAGAVFGLLGPNGAGKTTTVEMLEGYRRPDAGEVKVLGFDPWREGPRLRPRIGVMLQDGGLYPGIRPLEALRLFGSYYDDADDPDVLLDRVGLRPVAGTLVRRLSGGERQRLSFALALVGKPALVFLDEPTAGLDPHARMTAWALVRELRGRGVTVVLTTHAMDEAEQLCDRIAIVDRGRLVASGTPAELTAAEDAEELRFSVRAGDRVGVGVDRLALGTALGLGASGVSEVRAGEYVVRAPATPDLVASLTAWLRDHDFVLDELRTGKRTLEEVFLRLTSDGRR